MCCGIFKTNKDIPSFDFGSSQLCDFKNQREVRISTKYGGGGGAKENFKMAISNLGGYPIDPQ